MEALDQIRLQSLMNLSSGNSTIKIGIIDGPVDLYHPAFDDASIKTVRSTQMESCKNASSVACTHGTFVTGILCAKRGLPAPAICPNCEIILNPIFKEDAGNVLNDGIIFPSATPEQLSNAIIETVDAGANIINLSLGLSASSLNVFDGLQQAYNYSVQKGVIIVVAAGNQGYIGNVSLINHQWLIPVAASDENGILDPTSNFGPSIGNRGLMAPGVNIKSTYPGGQYLTLSGTSFATAFVTGSIALLWSIFRNASPATIRQSLRSLNHRSIIPPLLNAEEVLDKLKNTSFT
jgi:subtilisin family serine protease